MLYVFGEVKVLSVDVKEVGEKKVKVANVFCGYIEKHDDKITNHAISLEFWDSAAEYIGTNAKKGDKIILQTPGLIREKRWEVEGKKMSKHIIRPESFFLVKNSNNEENVEKDS